MPIVLIRRLMRNEFLCQLFEEIEDFLIRVDGKKKACLENDANLENDF